MGAQTLPAGCSSKCIRPPGWAWTPHQPCAVEHVSGTRLINRKLSQLLRAVSQKPPHGHILSVNDPEKPPAHCISAGGSGP